MEFIISVENKHVLKIAITFILNMNTEEQLIMHPAYGLYIQLNHSCEVSVLRKALLNAEEGTKQGVAPAQDNDNKHSRDNSLDAISHVPCPAFHVRFLQSSQQKDPRYLGSAMLIHSHKIFPKGWFCARN